ncbi:nodulation protein Z [Roseivirga ehrenbergii]|uniref:Alpha-(1,6)-fucosyltransferase N- and catalytic domain-containing protein n=1 Tax=Roseivirga ehrenbergii (strain DSM 102268 / JCM 13514 / KCTC 12282 / NCIMB 14502 / KMM 6017) TaxID=279360 RepID=A0A150XQP7_ROSEK|nr:O-fucosyltransferase family protein [Roseivirga ehrenbergii]KYG81033.1 hypothetical protein MB14_14735 [Roseivirga ehrenbergii]TCL00899.1 nodulation protein Z [Roseivirga ehrenbergii]
MQLQELNGESKILVIRINHSNAGFFAYLTFVLNQILYCEEYDLVPVVYFGPWSIDGPNAYHDPIVGNNMWDYYFEPVAGYTYSDIQAFIANPDHPITEENLIYLEDDVMSYVHGGNPNSIYNYPYGYYTDLEEDADHWYARQRKKAHALIEKYVHVKKELLTETNTFIENHFANNKVLGVHIRGTDKGCATEAQHLSKIIPPAKYFPHIDEFIQEQPEAKIFLATDQAQFVKQVRAKYPGRVLTQSTILSDSQVNVFQKEEGNNYQKGKEVLLDCLILSRCSRLLKCTSAVGEYALYFNPALSSLDLNELYGRPNFSRKMKTLFIIEPYTFMRDAVRIFRNPSKSSSALFWFILTDYPRLRKFSDWLESTQFSHMGFWRSLYFLKKYISLVRHKEEIPLQQVKQMAAHAIKRKGAGYYSSRNAKGKKYLEIRTDGDPQAAFFAQFLYVLQQIRFAEINHLIPVVNLDHSYNYYQDKGSQVNVWENFFYPVTGMSSSELDRVDPKTITFLSRQEQRHLFLGKGDEPPVTYDNSTKEWWKDQRKIGARLTQQYIRIRPEILSKVDDFYLKHLQGHTVLGIHLRGTDKSTRFDGKPFEGPELFTRIVPPEEYFPFIDKFFDQHPEGKLFAASDQSQFITTIAERYGDRVTHTRATRSSTEKAVFDRSGGGYNKGVEVLIDSLLLSKSDFLIKCMSNVGEVAVYFNPDIPVIDIFYPHSIEDFEGFFKVQ